MHPRVLHDPHGGRLRKSRRPGGARPGGVRPDSRAARGNRLDGGRAARGRYVRADKMRVFMPRRCGLAKRWMRGL